MSHEVFGLLVWGISRSGCFCPLAFDDFWMLLANSAMEIGTAVFVKGKGRGLVALDNEDGTWRLDLFDEEITLIYNGQSSIGLTSSIVCFFIRFCLPKLVAWTAAPRNVEFDDDGMEGDFRTEDMNGACEIRPQALGWMLAAAAAASAAAAKMTLDATNANYFSSCFWVFLEKGCFSIKELSMSVGEE